MPVDQKGRIGFMCFPGSSVADPKFCSFHDREDDRPRIFEDLELFASISN